MYSLQEAKKILGFSHTSYLRKLIAHGKINAVKKGNTWIITQEEMDRVLSYRSERFK
jgi:hypothetical protein